MSHRKSHASKCSVEGAADSFHTPFSFLDERLRGQRTPEFIARTMDICHGIKLCIELAHSSNMERDFNKDVDTPQDERTPSLDIGETDLMLRMAMATAGLLAETAFEHIEWLNQSAHTGRSV